MSTKRKAHTPGASPIEKAADFLCYLHARWQDESEYEDFAEYQKAIARRLPEGSKDVELTKKFKVTFTDANGQHHYIKITREGAEWGRANRGAR